MLLLLINPEINKIQTELVKPKLFLLADNSKSIEYLKASEKLASDIEKLKNNDLLKKRFDVEPYFFSSEIRLKDSSDFNNSQSNTYNALSKIEDLSKNNSSAIVLMTDGNQNIGRDFSYYKSKENNTILPVIYGDTTIYQDLAIEHINVNPYAFLNNRFPVEAFVEYQGKESVNATMEIRSGKTLIYSEKIGFSENKTSAIVNTTLPATSIGIKKYEVKISGLTSEKDILNNTKPFSIEVIDERTSVLILTDILHPDLGAFKKSIESNQQRSAEIKTITEKFQLSYYQLIVLYQVNKKFNEVVQEILNSNLNFIMVSGIKTDWNYLNSLNLGFTKNPTFSAQEIFPVYNKGFAIFQFEDIGFEDFPPLEDKFGNIEMTGNDFNMLLFQKIQGLQLDEPLMMVTNSKPKRGFIFGENFWRWRAKSFLDQQSFAAFDNFFGKFIQNLAASQRKDRLTINANNFFYANSEVVIQAQYFDENYQFDPNAKIQIKIINQDSEEEISTEMLLNGDQYEFRSSNLAGGNYNYNVHVVGGNISKSGTFEIASFDIEMQRSNANLPKMQSFAYLNETPLFFPNQIDGLINELTQNDKWKSVQKSHQISVPLIDWYWLLFLLVLFLAVEWFYRKYLGLI
ncbi:hypothetical protein DHD80_08760 [Gramella sp. AN32]|nr:hypothetical protein [Gramella sp. AN32]